MALSTHDSLGLAAGALTAMAFVPQIVRILKWRYGRVPRGAIESIPEESR